MTIFWDLDGVLRDLAQICLGRQPSIWDEVDPKTNMTICEMVNKKPSLLIEAPATPYLTVARLYEPITILTIQPLTWRGWTKHWIRKYIMAIDIKFFEKPAEKLEYLKEGDYLIEDYPFFSNYDQIILIDKPYNRDVKVKYRVKNPKELQKLLERLWKS